MLPRASTNNNSEKSSTPVPPTPSKDTKKAVIYVSGSHQKSEKQLSTPQKQSQKSSQKIQQIGKSIF